MKLNMSKKNIIIIASIVVILIVACVVGTMSLNKKDKKLTLEESLTQFGVDFYENYYYPGIKNKEILSEYATNGLNISIKAASVVIAPDDNTKSLLEKSNCDLEKTKLFFYPSSPYGAKDYELKIEFSCEK